MFVRPLLLSFALGVSVVACGDAGPFAPVNTSASLTVSNDSPYPIQYVYIASCSLDYWGNDQLGAAEVIGAGESRRWVVEPGCYDVRAVLQGGASAEWRTVQLTSGGTLLLRLTQQRVGSLN